MTSAKWVLHAFTLTWNFLTTIFELLFQVLFSHKDASLNLQSFDPLQTIEQTLNKTEELPIDVRSSAENCSVAHEVLIQPTASPIIVELPLETPTIVSTPPSTSDLPHSSEIPTDKADSSSSEDESLDQPSDLAAGKSEAPSDEKKKRKRRRGKKKKAQEGDATPVVADSAASVEIKPVEKKTTQPKTQTPKKEKSPTKTPTKSNDKSPAKNGQTQSRSNSARPSSLFNNNRWDTHDTDRWEHKRFSHSVLKTAHDETSASTIRPIRQPIGPSMNSNGFSEEYRKSRLAALVKANSEQYHAKNTGLPIAKALSV